MRRARPAFWVIVLAVFTVSVACGGGASVERNSAASAESVVGMIQELDANTLLDFDSLVIRDESGELLTLDSKGFRFEGFSPSHLRQHMVLGTPIKVRFHRENGSLIIDGIGD